MEVGQKVQVRRLRDRVSNEIVQRLGQTGTIRNFKITDGNGVGVLIQFDDRFATWFFEDEVEAV